MAVSPRRWIPPSSLERLEPAEINLGRLWKIDRLVESIADGRIPFEDGPRLLED